MRLSNRQSDLISAYALQGLKEAFENRASSSKLDEEQETPMTGTLASEVQSNPEFQDMLDEQIDGLLDALLTVISRGAVKGLTARGITANEADIDVVLDGLHRDVSMMSDLKAGVKSYVEHMLNVVDEEFSGG